MVGKHDVDSIVYLAVPALAGVSPADEFKTNTQGYLNVLEAGRQKDDQTRHRDQLAGHLRQRQGVARGTRT